MIIVNETKENGNNIKAEYVDLPIARGSSGGVSVSVIGGSDECCKVSCR